MNIQELIKKCHVALGENPSYPRVVVTLTDNTQDIMNLCVQPVMVTSSKNVTEMIFDANELLKALKNINPNPQSNVIQLRRAK